MKLHLPCIALLTLLAVRFSASAIHADEPDPPSELFESNHLVYEDHFDSGEINLDFWEIRQRSTWKIVDGVLTGSESSKEFQEKKIAAGDKAHAGFKPVVWLKQVPENFVVHFRMRYNAENYHARFPLLDVGHHIHTLNFREATTTLTIKKDVEVTQVESALLPLNEWAEKMTLIPISFRALIFLLLHGTYSSLILLYFSRQTDFRS